MEKGSDEIFFLQKTVMELQKVVFEMSTRLGQVEQALEKERAQKAAAGRASAKKRWAKEPAAPEIITALQIQTPKKTRTRKEKSGTVVTALLTALPKKEKFGTMPYELAEHWRAEYKRTYGTEAMKTPPEDFGHAKVIIQRCDADLERAKDLVSHFMSRRDSYYLRNGHKLQVLRAEANRLWAELNNGQIISSHDAKRAELLEHNDSAASKPLAENPLDTFDKLVASFSGGSNGNERIQGTDTEALPSASCGHDDNGEPRRRSTVRLGSSKD